MILWLALFLLVIAVSLVLALRSMRDYQEIPQKSTADYALFLIRQTENFNSNTLDSIRKLLRHTGLIISMERLFKGSQAALTIFGPKKILDQFIDELNLLELEDYASVLDSRHVSAWEVGVRDGAAFKKDALNNIFNNFPPLESDDQFFWQVVLGTHQAQIRAVLYSKNPIRRKTLAPRLQNLSGGLIKIPKPFSSEQMMDFYRLRSLSRDSKAPFLDSEDILRLLKIF